MPDRGLEDLARLFPLIRHRVPGAELFVTADFSLWGQPPGTGRYKELFYGLAGVHYLAKVSRRELVALQRSARVMAYPCTRAERFSISALECIDSEQDWDTWLRLRERFGLRAFAAAAVPVCYYWIHHAERARKHRQALVDGLPVREYFRRRYGATPGG